MDPTSEKTTETSEDFHDELVRIKEENNTLNRRLLGVNELARLLQEKTEVSNSLQEKNKRLEIAVVRLENRCSNIERKAKTAQYSSLPTNPGGTANPKSMPNSPFIPGPSRQILESLMKENHELKKTINNLTKGGPVVGYKEAVKMNHLEEVIDQKNGKIDLLQKQIENLTAPHDDDGSRIDPGLLKRQLLKMEQAMKVKDRFCTLLSDRVSELERGTEGTDGDGETEKGDSDVPTDSSRLVRDLEIKEKKFRSMIDELQSQVEKERGEKKDLLSKAEDSSRKVANLDSEIVSLNRKVESLSTYNNTLVSEKMDLSGDVMRLNDKLQQTQSETKKKDEEFQRKFTDMQEKFKDLEEDNASLKSQLYDTKFKLNELAHKPSSGGGWGTHIASGLGVRDSISTRPYDPLSNRGQEVAVDGRGPRLRNSPEPQQQQHCGSNMVHYMHQTMLATRDVDDNPDTTVPSTVTTPAITPSSAGMRSLDLSMQQNYRYRNPQTPSQYSAPLPNQQFVPVDSSHWQQHQFVSRPQSLTSSVPSNTQAPPPMSMPHPYHIPNMPPNAPPTHGQSVYSGTVFGNVPPQFTNTNPGMGSTPVNYPGSGYMTHSNTDYQTARYYTSSPQPPTLQRRPSPPNQHNNGSGSQHYHTGQ